MRRDVRPELDHKLPIGLMELLPSAPASVLLLSSSDIPVGTELEELGYQVSRFPTCRDDDFAQWPTGTRDAILQVDIPLPESAIASFNAAIVHGLSPKVHPLALWNQLDKWLAHRATVVIVVSNTTPIHPRMERWFDYVISIGARSGFHEQSRIPNEQPRSARDNCRTFMKTGVRRWQIRHVCPNDYEEIATLFRAIFGHPLSRALWSWKYEKGHGNAVVAARNGKLIAHYGGIYRDVMICGELNWVFQICDVMVHPEERGVFTRQGPFLLTAATSAEIYGPLGYGFPNDRHAVLAEKVGIGTSMGRMVELRWPIASTQFFLGSRVKKIGINDSHYERQVLALWMEMASDLRCDVVGVRDWAYLKYRYFEHPEIDYEVLMVSARFTGRPMGVMVMKRVENACELVDLVTPLHNLPIVIGQARRMAARLSLNELYCWISKNQVVHFSRLGAVERDLDISIPNSSWTNDPRSAIFKDKWWLMSGDSDFR